MEICEHVRAATSSSIEIFEIIGRTLEKWPHLNPFLRTYIYIHTYQERSLMNNGSYFLDMEIVHQTKRLMNKLWVITLHLKRHRWIYSSILNPSCERERERCEAGKDHMHIWRNKKKKGMRSQTCSWRAWASARSSSMACVPFSALLPSVVILLMGLREKWRKIALSHTLHKHLSYSKEVVFPMISSFCYCSTFTEARGEEVLILPIGGFTQVHDGWFYFTKVVSGSV